MLGYINENNIFTPNNNMMFKVEEIVEKINEISRKPDEYKNELSQDIASKLIQTLEKLNESMHEQVAQSRKLVEEMKK